MRMTINFLMKKARQKTNGELPVYVRFTLKSKRVELSTGIYCHPDNWDEVGQQIKGRNDKHYKSFRKRLAAFIKYHYSKKDYPVESIDYKFLDAFDVYLKKRFKVHQKFSTLRFSGIETPHFFA
ncbi:MAG: viroplasmin family protein [Draconibacterium sp.]